MRFFSLYPIAEIAAKSKSTTIQRIVQNKLCYDISNRDIVNWKAKKPKDFLKISLNELKDYEQTSYKLYSIETLEAYARHKRKGEKLPFDLCHYECSLMNYGYNYKEIMKLIDIKQLWNYKKRQQKNGTWKGERTYLDYLDHTQK